MLRVISHAGIALITYHVIICSIAAFIRWDVLFFNISEWDSVGRLFYLIIGLFIFAITLFCSLQEQQVKG